MKGFWMLHRDGINRIFKNGKSYPRFWSSKPMTGKELDTLENYYNSLDKENTLNRD